jgi:hypothetical protein
MTVTVNIPGVGSLNFPDGMSQPDMAAAIQKNFPQIHNPANTKVPGYTASDTGQFTPIQNAGQKAPEMTGNAALGALQGASNSVLGAGNAMAAGAYAALKPHSNMDEASQNFDTANQFLQGNQIGPSQDPKTEAARQAVMQAVMQAAGTVVGAPQTLFDTGANKLTSVANKLPWAPAVNQFINQHPALQKFQAATQGFGDVAANTALPAIAGKTAGLVKDAVTAPSPLADANALGYKVAPSDAVLKGGSAPIGKVVEGLAGSPKLQVDASVKNQGVTNDLAAQDIGVPKGTALTPEVLDAAEQPHYKAYDAVKSVGQVPIDSQFKKTVASIGQESQDAFPMDSSPALDKLKQAYLQPDSFGANGAVLKIRQLRKDGNLNIASRDPEKMQLGYAQRQIAGAIEDQIDRYASSRPEGFDNPNLIQNFRDARQALAKINTIRDSITPGTTDVSAPYLAKQLNRGAPLSGNTLKIADTYNNFPSAMRPAGPLRNKTQVNAMEGMFAGGTGLYGIAAAKPKIVLDSLAMLTGRPLARAGLLSAPFQNSMLPKAPMDPMLMRLLMGGAPAALNAQNQNPLLQGNKQ